MRDPARTGGAQLGGPVDRGHDGRLRALEHVDDPLADRALDRDGHEDLARRRPRVTRSAAWARSSTTALGRSSAPPLPPITGPRPGHPDGCLKACADPYAPSSHLHPRNPRSAPAVRTGLVVDNPKNCPSGLAHSVDNRTWTQVKDSPVNCEVDAVLNSGLRARIWSQIEISGASRHAGRASRRASEAAVGG